MPLLPHPAPTSRPAGRPRRLLPLLALVAAASIAAAPAAAAEPEGQSPPPTSTTAAPAPAPVTLTTQPEESSVTLNFEEERGSKTLKILLLSSAPLTAPPDVVVSDLHTGEGVVFAGTVVPKAVLADSRTVSVTVAVDTGGAKSGDYSGRLLLHGAGVADAGVTVTVKLKDVGLSSFLSWAIAIVALALGLALGIATKWLSDTGTKLQSLTARFDIVQAALKGLKKLPATVLVQVLEVREHLANGDVVKAEASFKGLEEHSSELIRLSGLIESLGAELRRQQRLVGQAAEPWQSRQGELEGVIHLEQLKLDELLGAAWPDPASGAAGREQWGKGVLGYSGFLEKLSNPAFASKAGLDAVLSLYRSEEFEEAQAKLKEIVEAQPQPPTGSIEAMRVRAEGADLELLLAEDSEEPAAPEPGLVAGGSNWAVRHAGLLLQVGLGVGLLAVGLVTVFKPDEMFHGDAVPDVIALFSWGVAAGLTGVTVASVAGKLSPSNP